MPFISIICNLDSRPGVAHHVSEFTGHNNGCRSYDLFTHGLRNKRRFFAAHDHELIAYVDEHERVPDAVLNEIRDICDSVTVRKHTKRYRDHNPFNVFNDISYLHALSQARGEIVAHFDQDTACFSRDSSDVDRWLAHLDTHRFVSYPARTSPRPVDDSSFGKHTWASTRAFACRREWLKFDTLERMLREPEWGWKQFGEPLRKLNWLEHLLALSNEESVIYPRRDDDNLLMFCWSLYHSGVMAALNEMSFEQVREYVRKCGDVQYPCDVRAQPIP